MNAKASFENISKAQQMKNTQEVLLVFLRYVYMPKTPLNHSRNLPDHKRIFYFHHSMGAPQQTTFHVQLKAANDLGGEDAT